MGKFVVGVQYIDLSAWILQYVWKIKEKFIKTKYKVCRNNTCSGRNLENKRKNHKNQVKNRKINISYYKYFSVSRETSNILRNYI